MSERERIHFVVATGIVVKDGKFLIAKRASWEKAFPDKWTVPGGKLEMKEYTVREKDTGELWYNVIENLVEREVKEEVGLQVENLQYLTSLSYIRSDGVPTIIVSMFAKYKDGDVKLCKALTEHAWVSLEEAKQYDLIDGIFEELEMLDSYLKEGKTRKWKKTKQ